jgi:hypothetical protein
MPVHPAKLQWNCRQPIGKIILKTMRDLLLDSDASELAGVYAGSAWALGETMDHESSEITSDIDLRPIVGLLSKEPEHVIEILTVDAIKKHRTLVDRAERLFQIAHTDDRGGEPSEAHVAYLEATIEMHAQMSALTTLLNILGRTPEV